MPGMSKEIQEENRRETQRVMTAAINIAASQCDIEPDEFIFESAFRCAVDRLAPQVTSAASLARLAVEVLHQAVMDSRHQGRHGDLARGFLLSSREHAQGARWWCRCAGLDADEFQKKAGSITVRTRSGRPSNLVRKQKLPAIAPQPAMTAPAPESQDTHHI